MGTYDNRLGWALRAVSESRCNNPRVPRTEKLAALWPNWRTTARLHGIIWIHLGSSRFCQKMLSNVAKISLEVLKQSDKDQWPVVTLDYHKDLIRYWSEYDPTSTIQDSTFHAVAREKLVSRCHGTSTNNNKTTLSYIVCNVPAACHQNRASMEAIHNQHPHCHSPFEI